MTVLALILARAGSKGVPAKNRAIVGGRPCVAWSIEAARDAKGVDRVAVSTDDPAIAAIAGGMGVPAIDRPAALATDTARVDDAARDAVLALDRSLGAPAATTIIILYANVPIRPAGLIDRAIDLLHSTSADSVQSYQPVGKHHPWWTARVDEASGRVGPWEGDVLNHGVFRRQDLPPAFIPDGAVLGVTRRALMLEVPGVPEGPHAFFGLDRRGIINPEGSVVDIDTPLDLIVADAMLRERGSRDSSRP